MFNDKLKALATMPEKTKKNTEECLIDGMTPYTYERYQRKLAKEEQSWTNCKDTAHPSLHKLIVA